MRMLLLVVVVERMLVVVEGKLRQQVDGMVVVGHTELEQRSGRMRPVNFVGISVNIKKRPENRR